jgi:6-phosphofructokinase
MHNLPSKKEETSEPAFKSNHEFISELLTRVREKDSVDPVTGVLNTITILQALAEVAEHINLQEHPNTKKGLNRLSCGDLLMFYAAAEHQIELNEAPEGNKHALVRIAAALLPQYMNEDGTLTQFNQTPRVLTFLKNQKLNDHSLLFHVLEKLELKDIQKLDKMVGANLTKFKPIFKNYLCDRLKALPSESNSMNEGLTRKVDQPGYFVRTFGDSKPKISLLEHLQQSISNIPQDELYAQHPTILKVTALLRHFENQDRNSFEAALQVKQTGAGAAALPEPMSWKIYQAAVQDSPRSAPSPTAGGGSAGGGSA